MTPHAPQVLAGDVGGTKTLLALAHREAGGKLQVTKQSRYSSAEYPGIEPVVADYLERTGARPDCACFGLPGPVVGERWSAPNLSWRLERAVLEERLGFPILLINDFHAAAFGIGEIDPSEFVVLQEGAAVPGGPRAILGAGTGLGEAVIFGQPDGFYEAHPTEGGHCDFAAQSDIEWRLRGFLARRHGHVSYERIVSGSGLASLYEFLVQGEGEAESAKVHSALVGGDDPASVITRFGLAGGDTLCDRALSMFVSVYGAEAGNLALRAVATGGLFVGGGIAPRIVDRLLDGTFMRAFREKGRFSAFMEQIRVSVIMNSCVGLYGAAARALRM